MNLYAVIHEKLSGENQITLVSANTRQEAKDVYLKHVGLIGLGTQLKVDQIDTSQPSVILSVSEK